MQSQDQHSSKSYSFKYLGVTDGKFGILTKRKLLQSKSSHSTLQTPTAERNP